MEISQGTRELFAVRFLIYILIILILLGEAVLYHQMATIKLSLLKR